MGEPSWNSSHVGVSRPVTGSGWSTKEANKKLGWARARAPVTPNCLFVSTAGAIRRASKNSGSFEEERLFLVCWNLFCNPRFISFKIDDKRLAQYV